MMWEVAALPGVNQPGFNGVAVSEYPSELAGFTVCISIAEAVPKSILPAYDDVIVSNPMGRDEVLKTPTPAANVAVPNVALPFMKVTLPVGVPADEDTVAVNVTDCP
jgi:hypothetical protein